MARATERLFGQTFGVRVKPSTTTKNETQLAEVQAQQAYFWERGEGGKADLFEVRYAAYRWLPHGFKGLGNAGGASQSDSARDIRLGAEWFRNTQCIVVDDSALSTMSGLDIQIGRVY